MSSGNKPIPYKTTIYLFALGLMALTYLAQKIYAFSNSGILGYVNDIAQVVGYLCLLYICVMQKYKKKWVRVLVISFSVILVGAAIGHGTGWIRYALLIIAGRDIKYSKILKTLYVVFMFILTLSVFLYVFGISDAGLARRNAISLGFVHPNVAAIIIITTIFLHIGNKNKLNTKGILLLIIGMIPIFFVLKTQVAIVCLSLFPILYYIIRKGCDKDNVWIKRLACGAQLIMCAISYGLVLIYPLSFYDRFRTPIDMLFSYRPYLNYNNVMHYGISLFGQNVSIYNNSDYAYNYFGGFVSNQKFNTVDNSYILGMIIIGVIPMIIMFLCYIAVIRKAWKRKNYIIITISVEYAMYAFIENYCNEAFFFFTFFYLLANDDMTSEVECVSKGRKK